LNVYPAEQLAVDFFEPPVHPKHVAAVAALRAAKMQARQKASLTALADGLKINRMTVKRALAYQKLTAAEGVSEPYRVLRDATVSASRRKPRKRRPSARRPVLGAA
jgi:hypothetical protein